MRFFFVEKIVEQKELFFIIILLMFKVELMFLYLTHTHTHTYTLTRAIKLNPSGSLVLCWWSNIYLKSPSLLSTCVCHSKKLTNNSTLKEFFVLISFKNMYNGK